MIVLDHVPGHVLQLGERLDAGVSAADEGEGHGPLAHNGVVGRAGGVEPGEPVVAQLHGLPHGLEPDAVLGQSRNGQRAARSRPPLTKRS